MKRIAMLHRYPKDQIKQTNAAFPYLCREGVDVLTFRVFNRLNDKLKFLKSLAWILYAPWLVAGRYYDVIYCDDSFPFYPALVKLMCPRSKVVIRLGDLHLMYYTSGLLYNILHRIEVWTWRKVDKIITISKVMAQYVMKEMDQPWKVWVVRDPVDPADFPSNVQVAEKKIVMFHGLLTRNKNVEILIEAADYLPDIDFYIVGDGPEKKHLEQLSGSNVYFTGWKPFNVMCDYIATCRVGVALRSNNPGNEYVVTSPFLQYSVMGKPCLVTRRKVFEDYEWQFSTVTELVGKIRILLNRPEEGEISRQYVLKHHDARKVADKIWSLLSY